MSLTSFEKDFEGSNLIDKYEIISVLGLNKRNRKVWEVIMREKGKIGVIV